jgi:hypothetical protein
MDPEVEIVVTLPRPDYERLQAAADSRHATDVSTHAASVLKRSVAQEQDTAVDAAEAEEPPLTLGQLWGRQAGEAIRDAIGAMLTPNDAWWTQPTERGTLLMPDIRFATMPTITVDHGTTLTIHVTAPVVVEPRVKEH